VFLWLTLQAVDRREVGTHIASASLPILGLALVAKLVGFLFVTLRSQVVFRSVGTFSFGALFRSVIVVTGGNAILPLRLGELLRVHFLARRGGASTSACLGAVGLERLLDLFCLMAIFAAVTPMTMIELPAATSFWAFAALQAIGMAICMIASRYPDWLVTTTRRIASLGRPRAALWITHQVSELVSGLASLRTVRGLFLVLAATAGFWLSMVAEAWVWLWAFDLDLPWFTPFLILFFSALGTFLPSSPSAVGTYHFFTTQALLLVGVQRALSTSVVVVGHAVAFLPVAIVSLPWLVIEVVSLARARGTPRPPDPPPPAPRPSRWW
jgi:uncharacterized protein (TIRG00374 family)